MDESELRELVLRFKQSEPSEIRAAKAAARALAQASPEDFLALAKEYILVAHPFDDISLSIFFLERAANCGVSRSLCDWVGDRWDALGQGSRLFFVNAAIAKPVTIPTEFLKDLFFRKSTSEFERFRIFTGLYGTWRERHCVEELEIMIETLTKSVDADIRLRTTDLASRLQQSKKR